jgi:hypothetical protein
MAPKSWAEAAAVNWHDRTLTNDARAEFIKIARVEHHPLYDADTLAYDLAIVTLEEDSAIAPATLDFDAVVGEGASEARYILLYTGPRATASAWSTPILEDFRFPAHLSAHATVSIPTHPPRCLSISTDAFRLRPDVRRFERWNGPRGRTSSSWAGAPPPRAGRRRRICSR